jgi:hypothetical protein
MTACSSLCHFLLRPRLCGTERHVKYHEGVQVGERQCLLEGVNEACLDTARDHHRCGLAGPHNRPSRSLRPRAHLRRAPPPSCNAGLAPASAMLRLHYSKSVLFHCESIILPSLVREKPPVPRPLRRERAAHPCLLPTRHSAIMPPKGSASAQSPGAARAGAGKQRQRITWVCLLYHCGCAKSYQDKIGES